MNIVEPEPGSLLAALAVGYGQAIGCDEPAEFVVELPHGEKIRCLYVTDAKKVKALTRAALKWARETAMAGKAGAFPKPEWATYFVDDESILAEVFALSRLCVEPDFHNNQLNCLILARQAQAAFNAILNQINLRSANMLPRKA